MSVQGVTALITSIAGLVTAIGVALAHLQLRKKVNAQTTQSKVNQ